MRYGIIADIHSNLESLESVLAALKDKGVDEYICVGDIVGYGADPKDCLQMAREICKMTVAGNHDHGAAGLLNLDYFNPEAKDAVLWTKEQLNEEEISYLRNLELAQKAEDFLIVHATPLSPGEWDYIGSTFTAHKNFRGFEEKICFAGHSHIPIVFSMNVNEGRCNYAFETKIHIADEERYIINVGSVGQPRDGNPLASFAVYDTDASEVEINRVEYDIETAQKKIIDAGLPQGLASRLSSGA